MKRLTFICRHQHAATRAKAGNQLAVANGFLAKIRLANLRGREIRFDFGQECAVMFCHDATIISAIADTSSVLNQRRASFSDHGKNMVMLRPTADWRSRLEAAIERDGRSLREISLGAKVSHGYLHGILRDDKEPTLDRFFKICRELRVSPAYVLLGVELSPETEEVMRLLEANPSRRDAILGLLAPEKP